MPISNDAFGQALYDYLRGSADREVIERDDGYVDTSDGPQVYFRPYRSWPRHEREALRLARGRVLDVGCGAGRHALHLQQKGVPVVAIDASPLAVRVCRLRGVTDARVMNVTGVSAALGPVDTVLLMGNNFGLVRNPTTARWLLQRLYTITSGGARIIAETMDPYTTKRQAHLDYHKRNRARGRMPGQVRIRVRYMKHKTPWFDYLFVSRDELRAIVHGTGWRVARLIDSDGPVYVAVLEKDGYDGRSARGSHRV